jgi:hypothetical protein
LEWPLPITAISDKDRLWKPLSMVELELKSRMALVAEQRSR